jgi:hypothetical protein
MRSVNRFIIAIKFLLPIVLVSLIGTSCSEDNTTQPPPASEVPLARLSDIQVKVFNTSCATANCHASGSAQAGLVLSAGQSYANLINVNSVLFPGNKRVDEGNSSESILVQMLTGQRTPRMPYNQSPLSQAVIDSIKKWIDDGALNN